MRKMIIASVAAGLMTLAAPAFAEQGPAGTSEGHPGTVTEENPEPDYVEDNQVSCGDHEADLADTGTGLRVKGEGGAEGGALVVCQDGSSLPVQGRVIASGGPDGGWVAADGDADNSDERAQGWARVDVNAADGVLVRCGDAAANNTDAANPAPGSSSATCG